MSDRPNPQRPDTDAYMRGMLAQIERNDRADRAVLPGWAAAGLSGATFGFGDELTAGARSLFGGTPYNQALEEERANLERFRETNPLTAAGTELAGSLPTMLIPMGWALNLARAPATAATGGMAGLGQAARVGAITGATGGALTGLGEGEGVEGRLGGAVVGAGLGGATGAVAGPILSSLGAAAPRIFEEGRRAIGLNPDELGRRVVARQAAADSPDAGGLVRQGVQDEAAARAAGLPASQTMLAERLGPNAQATLSGLANQPGSAMTVVRDALEARASGRQDRALEALRATFGDLADARVARAATLEARSREGGALYQRAFESAPPLGPDDLRILERVPGEAVEQARRVARADGMPFNLRYSIDDQGRFIPENIPAAEDMHHIRSALRDIVERNRDQDNRLNTYGQSLNRLYNQLGQRLDAMMPDYRTARMTWGGYSAQLDAQRLGQGMMRRDPRELAARVAEMPPDARESFLTGAMDALRGSLSAVRTTGNANPMNALFSDGDDRARLRVMADALGLPRGEGEARFRALAAYFERENRNFQSEGAITRNSATALRQAAQEMLATGGAGGLLGYAMGQDPTVGAIAGAGAAALRRNAAGTINDRIARMLATTDPSEQRRLMAAVMATQRRLGREGVFSPEVAARAGFVGGQQPAPVE